MIIFFHDVRAILGFEGGTRARIPKAIRIHVILVTKFFAVFENLSCLGVANFFRGPGTRMKNAGTGPDTEVFCDFVT